MEDNKLEFKGWRENRITEQTPIGVVFQFLNILNERLIMIEDAIKANVDGKDMTLTEYWIEVQKQEYQKMMEELQKAKEEEAQKANEAN